MRILNIEDIRAHEWSKQYLWAVQFPDFPGLDWFPAVDVEENLGIVTSHEQAAGMTTFKVPKGTNARELKVTFLEFGDHRVMNWITDWMNKVILNNGSHVATVKEAARLVHVHKLKHDMTVIKTNTYMVYPEGTAYFHGTNESAVEMTSQEFTIVGY